MSIKQPYDSVSATVQAPNRLANQGRLAVRGRTLLFRAVSTICIAVSSGGLTYGDWPSPRPTPVGVGNLKVTIQGLGGNCLDVFGGNPLPGARVDNASCNGTVAQNFQLNYDGTITNFASYCLDVFGGNAKAGVLDFTTCNGTAAQQWHQAGAQFIGLAGECLDVHFGDSSPGTTVGLAACNGTAAQNWQIINTPTVLEGAGTKCLDIINGNTLPGARLQIFECNRGPNAQIYTFTAASEIRNPAGECLDVMYGNAAGGQVQIWPCNSTASQKWYREGRALRSYLSSGDRQYCLGTVDGPGPGAKPLQSALDHTAVGLAVCNGTEAQQWIAADLYAQGPATLLIVTSDDFAGMFSDFIAHKQSIGVSTKLMTMTQVVAKYPAFTGTSLERLLGINANDDALSLKHAIEDHYRNLGAKYVLLGGDNARVPIRYQGILDGPNATTHSFRAADLYYANLYSGHVPGTGFHGQFDNWDANGNGYYDEQTWNNPLANPDNVDGFPDIAVGRIPAYDAFSLTTILNKIIRYEEQNPVYHGSGFPPAGRFGWAADSCYGPTIGNGEYFFTETDIKDVQEIINSSGARSATIFVEEVGQLGPNGPNNKPTLCQAGTNSPLWVTDTTNWDHLALALQNSEYEFLTYLGHGAANAWGYKSTWSGVQIAALRNQYPPIVFGIGCQTAVISNDPEKVSYIPPEYDPNASGYSSVNIGSQFLFNSSGGAVAYAGENIVMEDQIGAAFVSYLFTERANGYARLGDMWRKAQQDYFNANFTNPSYDQNFSVPRTYLAVEVLLGDPSMRMQ
jgi:hypothetical protein